MKRKSAMPSLRNAIYLWRKDRPLFYRRIASVFFRMADSLLAAIWRDASLYRDMAAQPLAFDCARKKRFLIVFSCNPFLPSGVGTSILAQCDLLRRLGYAIDAAFYVRDDISHATRAALLARFDRAAILFPKTGCEFHPGDGVTADCLDAWCGRELIDLCRDMLREGKYAGIIAHQPWLSAVLEAAPKDVRRYLFMHDNFADRAALFARQGLERHFAWLSTSSEEQARCMRRADIIFAVQEEERTIFARQIGEDSQVIVAKIPLPDKTDTPMPAQDGKLIAGIVASANANNRIAVNDFVRRWEAKSQLCATAELRIAGDICNFVRARDKSVHLLGVVDNLEKFYTGISVVINPDCGGTGIKVKSLEACSYGRPLLCSREGSKGLNSDAMYHALPDRERILQRCVHLARQREELADMRKVSCALFHCYEQMEEYVRALG